MDFDEDKEANVYGNEAREALEENDEISPEEEAFMAGYDEDEKEEEDDSDEYERAFDDNSLEEDDAEDEEEF